METLKHRGLRPCTLVWLLLLTLTVATYAAAQLGLQGKGLILGVLALAIIKGQLVVDHFMGLRRVGSFWRPLLGSYLLLVGGLIATAFLLPQG
jgi:cytochrome c oxidase subunit IV